MHEKFIIWENVSNGRWYLHFKHVYQAPIRPTEFSDAFSVIYSSADGSRSCCNDVLSCVRITHVAIVASTVKGAI